MGWPSGSVAVAVSVTVSPASMVVSLATCVTIGAWLPRTVTFTVALPVEVVVRLGGRHRDRDRAVVIGRSRRRPCCGPVVAVLGYGAEGAYVGGLAVHWQASACLGSGQGLSPCRIVLLCHWRLRCGRASQGGYDRDGVLVVVEL